MGMFNKTIAAITLAIASTGVVADDTGFFFGGGAGYSHLDANAFDRILNTSIAAQGFTGRIQTDDEDLAWKAFFGYDFGKNFGIEVGYVDLGESETTALVTAPFSGNSTIKSDITGYTLNAIFRYPFSERFEVFGKIGGFFSEFDNEQVASGVTINGPGFGTAAGDDSDTSVMGGVGFKFGLTEHVFIRADWDRYINVGAERDIDSFTGGVEFSF